MVKYKNKKKFILLAVLVLLLSSCAIKTKPSAIKQQNINAVEDKEDVKQKIGAVETEYHFFFDKFFKEEELTTDEKRRYEEQADKIMSFLVNAEKVQEQCMGKARQTDAQFTDKHLGKNSIIYADSGANGVQYNTRLVQAIKIFAACVNENEENIKEIAIYNKLVYDALSAEYNAGLRVFQEKEIDRKICGKADLSFEQKTICETIDKNYLISRAEKAYAISPYPQEKKKTKKEIKEEVGNSANIIKQIQELEGLN